MKREEIVPWERHPGESEKAYEAFKLYRDLGSKRSNREVSEKLSKSRQLISRWKAQWNWDERVRAYDTQIEKEAYEEAKKSIREMSKRHVKISMQLQQKALLALQDIDVKKMSPRDIKEWLKMATELEKASRGMEMDEREQFIETYPSEIEYIVETETAIYGEDDS